MYQPVKRYVCEEDIWISHENRMVKAGEEFEAAFPKEFKPSGNIREVKPTAKAKE